MVSGTAGSQGTYMSTLIDKASKFPKSIYQFYSPLPAMCESCQLSDCEHFGGSMVLSWVLIHIKDHEVLTFSNTFWQFGYLSEHNGIQLIIA